MLDPLLKEGMLPNFQKIIEDGVYSELQVTIPPVTIPSWPCLFSGISPEDLNYYWFDHPKNGLFNSNFWKSKSIFSMEDIKHFIINVPGTYPAWKINGEIIAGMLSPYPNCYPDSIKNELNDDWIIDGKSIQECFKAFKIKKNLFLKKLNQNFNLLTFVIRLLDTLSHHTKLDWKIVKNYLNLGYIKIDQFLGEIIENHEIDNIMIISDHGLKLYKRDFSISKWLESKNLLHINESNQQKIFSFIGKIYDYIRWFINIDYQKLAIVKNKFFKKSLGEDVSTRKKKKKSKALAFLSNVGGLFLDKENKYKKKTIAQNLRIDNHVKEVIIPNLKYFPDLFIVLEDDYLFNHRSSLFLTRFRNTINHSQKGLFIASGKNIKKKQIPSVNFIDFVPTILKLFSLKKKRQMKGKPLDIIK